MKPDLVDLGALVADGRLRPQDPDRHTLELVLAAALTDLAASTAVERTSPAWAESIVYEAGLRAARTIVQAAGFRIAVDRGHVTAIDAADALTDGRLHRQFVRIHRMRRVRHEFMYEVGHPPTTSDLLTARRDVDVLLAEARAAVSRIA